MPERLSENLKVQRSVHRVLAVDARDGSTAPHVDAGFEQLFRQPLRVYPRSIDLRGLRSIFG